MANLGPLGQQLSLSEACDLVWGRDRKVRRQRQRDGSVCVWVRPATVQDFSIRVDRVFYRPTFLQAFLHGLIGVATYVALQALAGLLPCSG